MRDSIVPTGLSTAVNGPLMDLLEPLLSHLFTVKPDALLIALSPDCLGGPSALLGSCYYVLTIPTVGAALVCSPIPRLIRYNRGMRYLTQNSETSRPPLQHAFAFFFYFSVTINLDRLLCSGG